LKILLWHGYLLGGTGSNVYTRSLARFWSGMGHEVIVFCQDPDPRRFDLGTATVVRPRATRPKVDRMPQWNVILHNDDVNEVDHVVWTIVALTTLPRSDAITRMLEAHQTGMSLLLSTHQEHAELLSEQFASKSLTVTIEPG